MNGLIFAMCALVVAVGAIFILLALLQDATECADALGERCKRAERETIEAYDKLKAIRDQQTFITTDKQERRNALVVHGCGETEKKLKESRDLADTSVCCSNCLHWQPMSETEGIFKGMGLCIMHNVRGDDDLPISKPDMPCFFKKKEWEVEE